MVRFYTSVLLYNARVGFSENRALFLPFQSSPSYRNDIIIQINNVNGIEIHNINARVSCFTCINTAIIYTALTNEATIRNIRRRPKGHPAGIKVFS